MNKKIDEIVIDGETYIPKNMVKGEVINTDGMKYVIVRTYSAGVFAGYLAKEEGQEVVLHKARRLWKWSGAASLSQLAMEGVKNPSDCKFPCETDIHKLKQVIEIIDATPQAKANIDNVPIWAA